MGGEEQKKETWQPISTKARGKIRTMKEYFQLKNVGREIFFFFFDTLENEQNFLFGFFRVLSGT